MGRRRLYERYRELQTYVGWSPEDAQRIVALRPLITPHFPALIDDFYAEIERHPEAMKVITGGREQIDRLKGSLLAWLDQLFSGNYDSEYVDRRWRVGFRHVEIGLDQVFTNAALSRLRDGLVEGLFKSWPKDVTGRDEAARSLAKLVDLDLAIIEDAYQTEYASRLKQTERLATLGQISGGVAHELRNPLNVIKTSIYYLLNAKSASSEKRAEHLQRIERHVDLADGVITALSSFARLPAPNLTPTSTEECIRKAIEFEGLGSDGRLDLSFPPDLPRVMADQEQLRIVFANLIRNARDAISNGGGITISATLEGEFVSVQVADSGIGIAPEHLAKIMDPLYSTKARGLGLGLAIARSIVEKNQGTINVTSEPNRGSTFTVVLKSADAT